MFKATEEDISYAKMIYETQIKQMVYKPHDLKQAHKRLFGFDATTPQQARTRLNAFFLYQYKADKTETALPKSGESETLSLTNEETIKVNYTPEGVQYNPQMISGFHAEDNEGQSHSEEDNKIFKDIIVGGIDNDNPILEKTMEDITVDFNDKPLTIFNVDNETKEALKDLPLQPDEEAPAEITKPKRGRKSKKTEDNGND